MNEKSLRDDRLDLIKAISIILVLLWHFQPIQFNLSENSGFLIKLSKYGLDQFNYQVTLLAVPLFLLVSVYLFFEKAEHQGLALYLKSRMRRIFGIYLFWTIFQTLIFFIIRITTGFQSGQFDLRLPVNFLEFIMLGGPPLPKYGLSVFYFLFVLLILTIIAGVYYSLINHQRLLQIISVSLIIASVFYFEYMNLFHDGIPLWRIDSFLIYVPIAYLIWSDRTGKTVYWVPILFLCFVLFTAYDLYIWKIGFESSVYARLSVVLGASSLFTSILQFRDIQSHRTILFLSQYSLGIYASHKYFKMIVDNILSKYQLNITLSHILSSINLSALISALISIGATIIFISIARKTPLRRFLG